MSGGAPSPPPDNSMQIEMMREQDAQRQQAAADAKAAQDKADLLALRQSSAASGKTSAQDYFRQQGLDPSQYGTDIDSQISSILAGISPTDPNPGAAFQDVGARIYNQSTGAAQAKAGSQLDKLFPGNFETSRINQQTIDPYLQGIDTEQRNSADAIIQNMLARGVITPSGQAAAESELTRQNPGVMAKLNEIGTGTVATEQQSLRDIANKGRTAAQTLKLGDTFDPNTYGSEADKQFSDFITNLGTTLRGKIGSSNLFNTTGLSAIAGAGQGAQNLPFDPTAQQGVIDPNQQANQNAIPSAVF
jgi:hypothetical protein